MHDNGRGFSAGYGIALRNRIRHGSPDAVKGIGLVNIAHRLKTVYGENAWLDIRSREGIGTVVIISIPVKEGADA